MDCESELTLQKMRHFDIIVGKTARQPSLAAPQLLNMKLVPLCCNLCWESAHERGAAPVYSPNKPTRYSSSTTFRALFPPHGRRILTYESRLTRMTPTKKKSKLRQSFGKIPSIIYLVMTQFLRLLQTAGSTWQTGVSGSGCWLTGSDTTEGFTLNKGRITVML